MGGLAGHMRHPHEAFELTILDFKEICKRSLSNKIKFLEKFDGLNMFVILSSDGIRLARNKKDIETGGFDVSEIESRFNNERVISVYKESLEALIRDLTSFFKKEPHDLEVVSKNYVVLNVECLGGTYTPNLISYSPYKKYVIHSADGFNVPKELNKFVKNTQTKVAVFCGVELSNNIYVDSLFDKLSVASDDMTLDDFYFEHFICMIGGEDNPVFRNLYDRIVKRDNSYNLKQLRKDWNTLCKDPDELQHMLDDKTTIRRLILSVLEEITLKVGTEILKHCVWYTNQLSSNGFIYSDPAKILNMIRRDEYNDRRWRICQWMIPKLEGVVFEYKGEKYKWTGPFAPLNAGLGGPQKDELK